MRGSAFLLAQATGDEPAGGAATAEALGATAGALVATALVALLIAGHRNGRIGFLGRASRWAERQTGLPGWAALPSMVVSASLLTAVLGMYWDISLHIDNGRDAGPLANPAHYLILVGLYGTLAAGALCDRAARARTSLRHGRESRRRLVGAGRRSDDRRLWRLRPVGFPAGRHVAPHLRPGRDAVGADPPDADRRRLAGHAREPRAALGGGRTLGRDPERERRPAASTTCAAPCSSAGCWSALSTFQGEFDFGVPQFRLVLHPVLIMLAAGDRAGRPHASTSAAAVRCSPCSGSCSFAVFSR